MTTISEEQKAAQSKGMKDRWAEDDGEIAAAQAKGRDKKRQRGRPRKKELPPATPDDGSYMLINTNKRNFKVASVHRTFYESELNKKDLYYREINKMFRTIREVLDDVRHNPNKYRHALSQSPDRLWAVGGVHGPQNLEVRVHFDTPDVLNVVVRPNGANEDNDTQDRPLRLLEDTYPEGLKNIPAYIKAAKERAARKEAAAKGEAEAAVAEAEEARLEAEAELSAEDMTRIQKEKNWV